MTQAYLPPPPDASLGPAPGVVDAAVAPADDWADLPQAARQRRPAISKMRMASSFSAGDANARPPASRGWRPPPAPARTTPRSWPRWRLSTMTSLPMDDPGAASPMTASLAIKQALKFSQMLAARRIPFIFSTSAPRETL